MIRKLFWVICAAVMLTANAASADDTAYAPSQPYDDPAMHYVPPSGYVLLGIRHLGLNGIGDPTAVAAWAKNPRTRDQITITVTVQNFNGTLDAFESTTEQDLRQGLNSFFVRGKSRASLSNGMPAYWLHITYGGDVVQSLEDPQQAPAGTPDTATAPPVSVRYQYMWIDGARGVMLAVTAPLDLISEDDARKILSSATAVRFPGT